MKDKYGEEINIGDLVAYTPIDGSAEIGIIKSIQPKSISAAIYEEIVIKTKTGQIDTIWHQENKIVKIE